MKHDEYSKARGGKSKMLDITCEHCGEHICNYQKDGPGPLKRMYLDRMSEVSAQKELKCPSCERILGTYMIYEKEKRPAYRLFVGAVQKKIIK